MSKRILITGSAGFVGSHTARWLIEKTDWQIVGLDSFRHLGDAERITGDFRGRWEIICHDLNAPISRRTDARIGRIDYVINCAAISHVDTSIKRSGACMGKQHAADREHLRMGAVETGH